MVCSTVWRITTARNCHFVISGSFTNRRVYVVSGKCSSPCILTMVWEWRWVIPVKILIYKFQWNSQYMHRKRKLKLRNKNIYLVSCDLYSCKYIHVFTCCFKGKNLRFHLKSDTLVNILTIGNAYLSVKEIIHITWFKFFIIRLIQQLY